MLNLQHRIDLLTDLGKYIRGNDPAWEEAKAKASLANPWFTREFIDIAVQNIAQNFLDPSVLQQIAQKYQLPEVQSSPKAVGLVMAGNIPLVGFHDWLCVFLSGHHSLVKLSSKDDILLKHLVGKMYEWEVTVQNTTGFAGILKGCDAYIATGSDNTARYFEYYFAKYPHIIRKNRTSVAILDGTETPEELSLLADDINQFFGLGCRNVTKLYVPQQYDFIPLLEALKKYDYFFEHNKYKHNYDYQLAIQILNNKYYMTSGTVLLTENDSLFSPISQVNYQYYQDRGELSASFTHNESIQCVVGHHQLPFGQAQCPVWEDYADGVNTLSFLVTL